jgi:hypothetical protein
MAHVCATPGEEEQTAVKPQSSRCLKCPVPGRAPTTVCVPMVPAPALSGGREVIAAGWRALQTALSMGCARQMRRAFVTLVGADPGV